MTLAQRLKQRRRQHHMLQRQAADAAGVTQAHYASWETEDAWQKRPPLARMLKLCAFYGVSLSDAFPEYRPTAEEREELQAMRTHLAGA